MYLFYNIDQIDQLFYESNKYIFLLIIMTGREYVKFKHVEEKT